MRFFKYHALGNDYLVLDPTDFPGWTVPSADQIRSICHRNFGVGSDGILWGPLASTAGEFGLRIFNPDGSEAEKSGNGLRIFCRYLWDQGWVNQARCSVETPGGVVQAQFQPDGRLISIEMGAVSFDSTLIPVAGIPREVLNEPVVVDGQTFTFCAATIGNPHCVIALPEISPELARRFGPGIETHALFPRRTNVQFMQVLDRNNLRLELWERGAGYTLASGSSSSAAAAVARRLDLVDRSVTVHMPGGTLGIEIEDGYRIRMTGPVTAVAVGTINPELFG